ncbi:hypothetical protein BY996DRAFT_4576812, partial [Phakopsora pachyrhizi]
SRIVKSSMSERLCTFDETDLDKRGNPTSDYLKLYKVWGEVKIGIIILGNISIHREYLEARGNLVIDKNSKWDPVEAIEPIVRVTKSNGSLVIGQLTHGGRQTPKTVNQEPVSASDSQSPDCFGISFGRARALSVDEIKDIVMRFGYGAEVLYKAGSDGVQLHAAHGYLLSQFLSPRVNHRNDDYGGSLENRSRIIFEIIYEIKRRINDDRFIISIKYNCHDFIEGGFSFEDCQTLSKRFEEEGVELIELSGGTYEFLPLEENRDEINKREGFFIDFAEKIKPTLRDSTVLAVTGGFRTLSGIGSALRESLRVEGLGMNRTSSCDMVGLGRPLVTEPDLIKKFYSLETDMAKRNELSFGLDVRECYEIFKRIGKGEEIPELSDDQSLKQEFLIS